MPIMKVNQEGVRIMECACGQNHFINLDPDYNPCWHWDPEAKTLSPSVHAPNCHFFIVEGKIQYRIDCLHDKAGHTLALE